MGNPWKNHGKVPRIPLKTWSMEPEQNSMVSTRGNFHAFHAGMEQENCKNILHESMESKTMENHGKHGNLQK